MIDIVGMTESQAGYVILVSDGMGDGQVNNDAGATPRANEVQDIYSHACEP
jgi:hypothetical protein